LAKADKLRVKGGAGGTLPQSFILSLSKDEGRSGLDLFLYFAK
jgi:hypothetical protein